MSIVGFDGSIRAYRVFAITVLNFVVFLTVAWHFGVRCGATSAPCIRQFSPAGSGIDKNLSDAVSSEEDAGAPGGTRTPGLQIQSQSLHRPERRALFCMILALGPPGNPASTQLTARLR
jgi:hypothetical protein